ncbi:hypothetical protein BdWA1_002142 [Babesia duncani]|uniref:PH domain-containing protein n=1 Tax=Babesia duncani TaxID=323732 RepID=A0AAD9PL85_9APIC|nr:hypothetical protein BdWA1_002142 [Babesia duncani]
MGANASIYTVRVPDGPLLNATIFNTTELSYRHLNKWGLNYSVFGFSEDILSEKLPRTPHATSKHEKTLKPTETPHRQSRRRPTYSAKNLKAISDDEETAESSSDSEVDETTAKNIRQEKILKYRKLLTKIVKIKCNIFHEKVKVTCSKDGNCLEWYKVKATEDDDRKRSLIGTLPVDKITSFKTKVDNLKCLEITAGTNGYIFTFKTRDEREAWQTEFDNFVRFMKLI